jgi:hypothetical protein
LVQDPFYISGVHAIFHSHVLHRMLEDLVVDARALLRF